MMEGQVPTEASPRVMHTERSGRSPRKSSTIRSTEAVRSLKISFIVQPSNWVSSVVFLDARFAGML
jgi:hypothetical protein